MTLLKKAKNKHQHFASDQLQAQVKLSLNEFRYGWSIGFFFFSIHLVLLGYLVFKSGYIPKIMGILLVIAGLGYLINTLKPFLFPGYNLDFIMISFFGELIFMLWLLIKGWKLRQSMNSQQLLMGLSSEINLIQ